MIGGKREYPTKRISRGLRGLHRLNPRNPCNPRLILLVGFSLSRVPEAIRIQWYTFPFMSEHRSVLKSTSTISALTVVSRIFGYIRDNRIAFLLGTGDLGDAYSLAFRIPNILRRLVGEGSVSAAFIPVFSQYLVEGKRDEAWDFVNAILSAAIVFMSIVVILGILGSSYIVAFFASGFAGDKLQSTMVLNRIMFPY